MRKIYQLLLWQKRLENGYSFDIAEVIKRINCHGTVAYILNKNGAKTPNLVYSGEMPRFTTNI